MAPITFNIGNDDRLGVLIELRPRGDLGQFFKRANAAGQGHKACGFFEHQSFAFVHGAGDNQLIHPVQHSLFFY